MARRNRQASKKALGPGHRQRNKNPKLSPYQRELKRTRLSNQVPRPFVNASTKSSAANGSILESLNPSIMYQKRDAPAKARGLMQYLQQKEEKAAERLRQKAIDEQNEALAAAKEEEAMLAYRERNENSSDSEESYDSEEVEETCSSVEELSEDAFDDDDDNNSLEEGSVEEDDEDNDDGLADALADLEKENGEKSDSEEISDDESSNKHKGKGSGMVLTHVPKDPSGKQLKAWMVKKERLAYLEMKNKGNRTGCENLLKKVLIGQGFTFIDPSVVKEQRKARREQQIADAQRKREEIAAARAEKNAKGRDGKGKRMKPVTEGELSTRLEDVNEEMMARLAPNLAAAIAGGNKPLDAHSVFAAEAAQLNIKLLKKKEKKHAKKSDKRRERAIGEFGEMEQKMVESMSKTHKRKVRKEKAKEGDANYKLHQKLVNQQLENLKAGGGATKRLREEDGLGNGHDPNVVLKFQHYENEQQAKKQIKRLSGMDESELRRAVDFDDEKGKLVEKIRFGERAEAPPVFSVVPSMSNSFSKFAMKLQQAGAASSSKNQQKNPLTARNNKINGVAVVVNSRGGVRAPQNKPGKATAMSLMAKKTAAQYNRDPTIVSTAARTDSTGDISLYERKRLAKLGLMEPVTEQRVNRSKLVNGGEGNSSHNASEMEALRQRVMTTYQNNRKAARKNGGVAPVSSAVASDAKSWLPTDRDY